MWGTLNRTRRKFIRLEGEPVAELDFASLFLRLAYLQVDQTPPDGDLYAALVRAFPAPSGVTA